MVRWNKATPIVYMILFASINLSMPAYNAHSVLSDVPPGLTSHSVIDIDGDPELGSFASSMGWNGSGTEHDPIIVRDIFIDAGGKGYCLRIFNVTSHLDIINSTFVNSTLQNNNNPGHGIWIENSSNITLKQITTRYCVSGLMIKNSSNVAITKLYSEKNDHGIIILSSRVVSLHDSRINTNSNSGIRSRDNEDMSATNTTISGYGITGMEIINSRQVHASGLMISSTSSSTTGILMDNSIKVSIRKCTVAYNTISVDIRSSKNVTVEDSRFMINSRSISVSNGSDVDLRHNHHSETAFEAVSVKYSKISIEGSIFFETQEGIRLNTHHPVNIRGCTFKKIPYQGIYFQGGDPDSIIMDCTFDQVTTGIGYSIEGAAVSNCTFKNCDKGIRIYFGSDLIINGSRFISNGFGIDALYMQDSEITGGLFYNNINKAIKMTESEHNSIHGNSFITNSGVGDNYQISNTQCSDQGQFNRWYDQNEIRGNHWSELTDPDTNFDEIVDSPYNINGDGSSSDLYPLVFSPITLIEAPDDFHLIKDIDSVVLEWTEPQSPEFGYLTSYAVYRGTNPHEMELISMVNDRYTIYRDRDIHFEREIFYQVRSVTNLGKGEPTPFLSVIMDDTPPAVRIISPSNGSSHSVDDITIEWTVNERESYLTGTRISFDEGAMIDLGLSVSYVVRNIDEGNHSFRVEVTNSNILTGSDRVEFSIDRTPPLLEWNMEEENLYSRNQSLSLYFTGVDNISGIDSFSYRTDHGTWLMTHATDRIEPVFEDGYHRVELKAIDRAGNDIVIGMNVTIDRRDPYLDIKYPLQNMPLANGSIEVIMRTFDEDSDIDRIEYSLDNGTFITLDVNDSFILDGLQDGRHFLRIRVHDKAGNRAEKDIVFFVDTVGPFVLSVLPRGKGVPLKPDIEVEFSKEMDQKTLQIEIEGTGYGNWYGNIFRFHLTKELLPGTFYEVIILCSDLAGNKPARYTWNFTTTDRGFILGKVVDGNGLPLKGADISVQGSNSVTSNSNGEFRIEATMGTVLLTVSKAGMISREISVRVVPDSEVSGVVVTLEKEGTVKKNIEWAPVLIVTFGISITIILIMGLIYASKRRKNRFEFFIDEDDPVSTTRGYSSGNNGNGFDDFWLDTGENILSDHYQVLGIPRDSNIAQIRKAYRSMAARYHPDKAHPMDEQERLENQEMMAYINDAKTVLLNQQHRMLYDAWLYDRDK